MNRLIKTLSLMLLSAAPLCMAKPHDDINLHDGWKVWSSESETVYDGNVPSTVLGVLTSNGMFQDAFVGDNYYRAIDADMFAVPWYYEKEFEISAPAKGEHVFLEFEGISYSANIWLNGKQIADRLSVAGPFRQHRIDVTEHIRGHNTLRVEVFRAQDGDFNIGFVDWNPRPADGSMGIFRPVWVRFSDAVSICHPVVRTQVDTATLKTAWLSAQTCLVNNTDRPVKGQLCVSYEGRRYKRKVTLAPNASELVSVDSRDAAMFKVTNPQLWWCHTLGEPVMHKMEFSFVVDGQVSDSKSVDFGIRQIDSYFTLEGHRGFILNGRKVLVLGAGWTDDLFLRNPDSRNELELSYVKDMGLNAVRFENIWGTSQNVYDLCDRMGLLALVGWSCFWEWEVYSKTPNDAFGCIRSEEDMNLIARSFNDQVLWLRNHPSIVAWYVGSDMLPRPELERKYLDILSRIDTTRPYIASAKALNSEVSGPTGMKMVGPYDYQAPSYWYSPQAHGGSFGFNTETGVGAQLPMVESIARMIPQDSLWPVGNMYDFHCTTAGEGMHSLSVLKEVAAQRYGQADNLEEFLLQSYHLDYDGTRAMFEGFRVNRPHSTGLIQWMLNSAWPSMYWQLYDWYMVPTAGYWSVKKACAPTQLVYDYVGKSVFAVNNEKSLFAGTAYCSLYSMDGRLVWKKTLPVEIGKDSSKLLAGVDLPEGVSFLFLSLCDGEGKEVADNVYALSSVDDVTDWAGYNWIRTPSAQYADYRNLSSMARAEVKYNVREVSQDCVEVELVNSSSVVAFFVRLSAADENGELIVPAYWEDNFISLAPSQTKSVKCRIPGLSTIPEVKLTGWNLSE